MTEAIGVYYVQCEIDGLPLQMVFDTGASYVSISRPIYKLLEKYGCITKDDYLGRTSVTVGDGFTTDYSIVNLRDVKVGNLLIHNVRAIIIDEEKPLMMLGQSAIKKLGKTTIDGDCLYIRPGKDCVISTYDTESVFESWNAEEALFHSKLYGIKWELPRSASWQRQICQYNKDFFFAWSEYSIAKLSITKLNRELDLWNNYENVFQISNKLLEDADLIGSTIVNRKQEKCTIQGVHAIKDTFKVIAGKNEDGDDLDLNYITHYFLHNGYFITASIRIASEIYENYDCQSFIDAAINGISLL